VATIGVVKFRIRQLVAVGASLTTLAITPTLNFDGVSLVKALVVSVFGFAILGILVIHRETFLNQVPPLVKIPLAIFIVWMFVVYLLSGAPLDQQLWGVFGRNNGLLTYFSLSFFFLGSLLIQEISQYLKVVYTLLATSLLVTGYSIIQLLGLDPIPWSEMRTFATLGNVNFLSAFLGMISVGLLSFILDLSNKILFKLSLLSLMILNLAIAYSTDSIQGPMIFLAGSVFVITFRLKTSRMRGIRLLTYPFVVGSAVFFVLTVMALFNQGPLAKIIFQTSIVLRGDYMHAGWAMFTERPIFGVGLDSYGDWYREMRGELSTLRGSPDRIANTAHNIFLDIGASGGAVWFLTYLFLVIVGIVFGLSYLRNQKDFDSIFTAIFGMWIAYLSQALISINQVGVGAWGWVLHGAVIGYCIVHKDQNSSEITKRTAPNRTRFKEAPSLPPKTAISMFVAVAVGFFVAVIPVQADANYKRATMTGDLEKLRPAVTVVGASAFHRELVLDSALQSKLTDAAQGFAYEILASYPRNFFAWKVVALTSPQGSAEQKQALESLRRLDPFNPELPR